MHLLSFLLLLTSTFLVHHVLQWLQPRRCAEGPQRTDADDTPLPRVDARAPRTSWSVTILFLGEKRSTGHQRERGWGGGGGACTCCVDRTGSRRGVHCPPPPLPLSLPLHADVSILIVSSPFLLSLFFPYSLFPLPFLYSLSLLLSLSPAPFPFSHHPGSGSFADVFKCTEQSLDVVVAAKIFQTRGRDMEQQKKLAEHEYAVVGT